MNDQLNSDIKAVFDDIVAATPPLGELNDSNVVQLSSYEQPRPRRWALPVAAGLILFTAGFVVFLATRPNTPAPGPVATDPVSPTETTQSTTTPDSTSVINTDTTLNTTNSTTEVPAIPTSPVTQAPTSAPATTEPGQIPVGSKTVLAFSDDGSSVQIAPGATKPEPLFNYDGLNDRWETIDYSPTYGAGFIGTCCEPINGAVFKVWLTDTQAAPDSPYSGYGVSISPNDRFVAIGDFIDNPVSIRDLANNGELVQSEPSPGWSDIGVGSFTPYDVLWLDDSRLLVLGGQLVDGGDGPAVVVYDVSIDGNGAITSVSERLETGLVADYDRPTLFAGQPTVATVALHQQGASDVTVYDLLFRSGSTEPLGDRSYDTVWLSPGDHRTTVDTNGELRIDGVVIPGTYSWARAT